MRKWLITLVLVLLSCLPTAENALGQPAGSRPEPQVPGLSSVAAESLFAGLQRACELEAFLEGRLEAKVGARGVMELDLLDAWASPKALLARLAAPGEPGPGRSESPAAGMALEPIRCDQTVAFRLASLAASGQMAWYLPSLRVEAQDALTSLRVELLQTAPDRLTEAWAVWSARRQMAGLPAAGAVGTADALMEAAGRFLAGRLPLTANADVFVRLPLWDAALNAKIRLLALGKWDTKAPASPEATWLSLADLAPSQWTERLELQHQRQRVRASQSIRWLATQAISWVEQEWKALGHFVRDLKRPVPAASAEPVTPVLPTDGSLPEATVPVERLEVRAASREAERQAEAAEKSAAHAHQRQAEALRAAAQTQDEVLRAVEAERARLLGLLAEAALFEGEIQRTRQHMLADLEHVLGWAGRVDTLEEGLGNGSVNGAEVDAAWDELMQDFDEVRARFAESVSDELLGNSRVPDLKSGLDLAALAEEPRRALELLREEVVRAFSPLVELEQGALEERSDKLYQASTELASVRIHLLDMLSEEKAARVTGMGSQGWQQVSRALSHLVTVLEYRIVSIPRRFSELAAKAAEDVPTAVFKLLLLVLVLVGGPWWYRRGQEKLRLWERSSQGGPAWRRRLLWNIRQVHKPLMAVVGLYLFVQFLGGTGVPELAVIWHIGIWVTGGLLVVKMLEALVSWYERMLHTSSGNVALRNRSFKVLGSLVIAGGLLLAVTDSLLGAGVLYRWLATLWAVSFVPVGLWVLRWWKPILSQKLEELPRRTAFTNWLVANNQGLVGWLTALLGAAVLLGIGLARWTLFAASRLHVARRLHAWLFRREVSKQARENRSEELTPIPAETRLLLALAPKDPVAEVNLLRQAEVNHLSEGIATGDRLLFLVGDKGAGKSTLLRSQQANWGAKCLWLECGNGGAAELLAAIASQLGLKECSESEIMDHLCNSGIRQVFVDEGQLLVRPVVHGLADLERLRTWVRMCEGSNICWVVALGLHAWRYVQRAAGSRILADQVIELPEWDEEEVAALLTQRTAALGLQPSFEGLVAHSAAVDSDVPAEVQFSEAWYYRLLWDYSGGNPAIALHFWADSLAQDASGSLVVRLFALPDETHVESLPLDLLFLLRVMVQMGKATPLVLAEATRLPLSDVTDALRLFRAKGFTELEGDMHLVGWHWRRAIVKTLVRQHLLVA